MIFKLESWINLNSKNSFSKNFKVFLLKIGATPWPWWPRWLPGFPYVLPPWAATICDHPRIYLPTMGCPMGWHHISEPSHMVAAHRGSPAVSGRANISQKSNAQKFYYPIYFSPIWQFFWSRYVNCKQFYWKTRLVYTKFKGKYLKRCLFYWSFINWSHYAAVVPILLILVLN